MEEFLTAVTIARNRNSPASLQPILIQKIFNAREFVYVIGHNRVTE